MGSVGDGRSSTHPPTRAIPGLQTAAWASDGSHQLQIISTNGCKATRHKRFPSSANLKLVLELHKLSPERPLSFFCLNFVSKAAFESLWGFGLFSVNFRTMKTVSHFFLGLEIKKYVLLAYCLCHSHSLFSHFCTSW